MKAMRAELAELKAFMATLRPRLPAVSACAQLDIGGDAAGGPLAEDIRAAVRSELRQASTAGRLDALPRRVLRQAPHVLWDHEEQAAGFPGVLDAYLAAAAGRSRWVLNLIEAWLRDFGPDRIRHASTGTAIAALVRDAPDPRLARWDLAHRRYGLFDPARGPQTLAKALLAGPGAPDEVLAETQMDDRLRAQGGFFHAATRALLAALPPALATPRADEAFSRAVTILEVETATTDRKGAPVRGSALRFPDLTGETAAACLAPWLGTDTPPGAPRAAVTAFLIRTIGDPRLHPTRWSGAPEACGRLMRGWLAAATLESFLTLIAESNGDKHFRYRRTFWRACLARMPKDKPGEVWVVLGPALAAQAKIAKDLQGTFGLMETSTQYGEQAVLLIRLGNIVLSEWSNVGPVRAWEVGDAHCPSLYKPSYLVPELRATGLNFPNHPTLGRGGSVDGKGLWHSSAERGLWQGCAAAFLKARIGLVLSERDYMSLT